MNIAPAHRLHYNELPPFTIGQLFDRVPTDQCPAEVQTWIMAYLFAKRFNQKIPPFPTRYEARYFGSIGINTSKGWDHFTEAVADCAAPDGIASIFDLPDWEDGTPVFPLDGKPR